jgi:regulator of protease activity HflC (stomatin/prohibitin superfamily)
MLDVRVVVTAFAALALAASFKPAMILWDLIFCVVFMAVIIAFGHVVVEQGHEMLVERFGKYHRTLGAGIHFIIPIVDRPKSVAWTRTVEGQNKTIVHQSVTLTQFPKGKELIYDPPAIEVITKDKISIKLDVVVTYAITDTMKAVYDIEDLYKAMQQLIDVSLRSICSIRKLDDLLESSDYINSGIEDAMKKNRTEKRWGVDIINTEIQRIIAPESITKATELLLVAHRQAESTIITQKAIRDAKILEAQAQQEVKTLEVKSETDRMAMLTKAEQEKRSTEATTEAMSIKALLGSGVTEAYLTAKLNASVWERALSDGSGKTKLVIPYEACKYFGASPALSLLDKNDNN